MNKPSDWMEESHYPARWWHTLDDGRIQCDLCPRDCKLHEGQRGQRRSGRQQQQYSTILARSLFVGYLRSR